MTEYLRHADAGEMYFAHRLGNLLANLLASVLGLDHLDVHGHRWLAQYSLTVPRNRS